MGASALVPPTLAVLEVSFGGWPWSQAAVVGFFVWALVAIGWRRREASSLWLWALLGCLVSEVLGLFSPSPGDVLATMGHLSKAVAFALIAKDRIVPLVARPYEQLVSAAERHRLELEEYALRSRQILDASTDAVMLCELAEGRLRYVDVNPAFERLTGVARAELIGKPTDESPMSVFAETIARCRRAGTTHHEEAERALPGGLRAIRSTMSLIQGPGGELKRLIGVLHDVTEERRVEQKLAEEKIFNQTVVLKAPFGVSVYRADGTCLLANEAYCRMVGSTREQLEAQRFTESAASGDSGVHELAFSVLATGRPQRHPAHFVTSFDRDLWVERQLVRVPIGGKPHLVVLLVDLTEAHLEAEAISSARRQLQRAAEVAGFGVWVHDLTDGTLHWDERMFELFEVPPTRRGALINHDTWRERCHPEDLTRATAELDAGIRGGEPFTFEFRIVVPSGEVRRIHAAAVVERDARGKPARVVGVNRDITLERKREWLLEEAKRLADSTSEAKNVFLEHTSLELKGPTSVIAGLADLLLDTALDATQRRYLERIRLASTATMGMLNDVLDYSRLEAGQLELNEADFSLEEVLRDTASRCSPRAEEQGGELVIEVAPEVPVSLHGDPARLGQLLHNLVGHAVAHAGNGEVHVVVERAIGGAGLIVSALGTVAALPVEDVGTLLQSFHDDAPTAHQVAGGGLSIELSYRLVHLMNGELVEGAPGGGGCIFRVFLPVRESDAGSGVWRADVLEPRRTLVVDDRESAGRVVASLLEPCSFEITQARSGAKALRAVEEAARAGRPFELLLIDCKMPGMDGLELARRARSLMGTWGAVSIVMMATSFGRERVLKAGSAEGVDAILEKPVLRGQLFEVLFQLQQGRSAASSG